MFTAETAPKDGTIILGDFGWPWLMPAAWSAMSGKWVVAVFQAAGKADEIEDVWWETDMEGDLKGWMPVPELPRKYEPVPFDT